MELRPAGFNIIITTQAIVTANANLLEIAGFGHKLKNAGCADELIEALTSSIKKMGLKIQKHRQDVEVFISARDRVQLFYLKVGQGIRVKGWNRVEVSGLAFRTLANSGLYFS